VPDVLANAGGVTVSYLNGTKFSQLLLSEKEVFEKLKKNYGGKL